jgi:hypothetical protein
LRRRIKIRRSYCYRAPYTPHHPIAGRFADQRVRALKATGSGELAGHSRRMLIDFASAGEMYSASNLFIAGLMLDAASKFRR